MKSYRYLLLCGLVLFCWVGSAGAKEFRIGVLYWSMNIPGQVAMRLGLEEEAVRINTAAAMSGDDSVTLIAKVAGDGSEGIENQIRQMQELIAAKLDLLIVQPTDNAALAIPLRQANAAGIPVIAYDQYIDGGTLAAYRTSDNFQAGTLDGEYIASRFPDDKVVQLILVEYPHVSSTVERVNGFIEALETARQKYKILKTYTAVEPVAGKKAGEDIVRDFPAVGSVDVVFTINDGGGLAVVEVLAAAGRSEILVASIDGDPQSVANIAAGRLTVIDSAQYCGPLGAETLRTAYAFLKGEKPPFHALVPVFPITAETLKMYSGWSGPMAVDFIKPWKSHAPEWRGSLNVVQP